MDLTFASGKHHKPGDVTLAASPTWLALRYGYSRPVL